MRRRHNYLQGEKLYSSVLFPCWEAVPSGRPSFAVLAARLAAHLGEDGVMEYEERAANYLRRCHGAPSTGEASGPAPPG